MPDTLDPRIQRLLDKDDIARLKYDYGWAIEHTNLGTIRLTAAGHERTALAITADLSDHPERQQLTAGFERFVRQVQSRFHVDV